MPVWHLYGLPLVGQVVSSMMIESRSGVTGFLVSNSSRDYIRFHLGLL